MKSIPTDRASKHTFWTRQVVEFNRSQSSTAAQFCREEGLPYQSFMAWQRRLAVDPEVSTPKPKSFVRIQAPSTKPNTITCRLPSGLEFIWDATTPPSTIAAVIQEVGQI